MAKGKSRAGNERNSYDDSFADINPLTTTKQIPYNQKLISRKREDVYPKQKKDETYRDLPSTSQNINQDQLIELIDNTLRIGRPTQTTKQMLNRKRYNEADGGFLYEEAANSIYEFSGDRGEVAHLKHLRACLTGEEDFFTSFYVQMRHAVYSDIIKAFKKSRHQKVDFSEFKKRLSPQEPLELLVLDAIHFIENNGNTNAQVEAGLEDRKDETDASKRYIEDLIEVIEGKKAYRLFVVCLRDGSTKTNLRILR